jgi:hypothetical protein
MLNTEERVAIVSAPLRGLSYQQVQQYFERTFRKPTPARVYIRLLVNMFKRTGSVLDQKPSDTLQTSENVLSKQLSEAHVHQFAA